MGKIKIGDRYYKKSVVLWNTLLVAGIYSLGFIDLQLMGGFLLLGSLVELIVASDKDKLDNHIWITFMPLTWLILLFGGIILGIGWIYKNTIVKFNNWLDKEDEKNTK